MISGFSIIIFPQLEKVHRLHAIHIELRVPIIIVAPFDDLDQITYYNEPIFHSSTRVEVTHVCITSWWITQIPFSILRLVRR